MSSLPELLAWVAAAVRERGEAVVSVTAWQDAFQSWHRADQDTDVRTFCRKAHLTATYDDRERRLTFRPEPIPMTLNECPDRVLWDMARASTETLADLPVLADWLEERGDVRAEAVRGLRVDEEAVAAEVSRLPEALRRYSRPRGDTVYGRAESNLLFTVRAMFLPLLDAHHQPTALRLHEQGIASVEELATDVLEPRGPAIWFGTHAVPLIGHARQFWAIDGRLYGDLRFLPGVDANRLGLRLSLEIRRGTETLRPMVTGVVFLEDGYREMADYARTAERRIRDTGSLRGSVDDGR